MSFGGRDSLILLNRAINVVLPSFAKVAGALVGCAVGDAMGAPFEGLWADSIPSSDSLLLGFHEYHGFPCGQYTDDTQLTLATIESIVHRRCIDVPDIARRIAELWRHHSVIGPGGACTRAAEAFLATGDHTKMGAPVGQAGNGTAMRTAVLGLWFCDDPFSLKPTVAEVSRLTHQDPRSIAGGVVVASAARILATEHDSITPTNFCDALAESCGGINVELALLLRELPLQLHSDKVHYFIANAGQAIPEFDRPIISPFVVPTVLASVYCLISHPHSWADAVTSAIRLGGDVDTLGAIVGALAGARHGIQAIPTNLVETVHNSRYIQKLAMRYHSLLRSNGPGSNASGVPLIK